MAFPQGINFRATAGYVTDGANEDHELAAGGSQDYPWTTAQGNSVGWENGGSSVGSRDRNSALDRRLAGTNQYDSTPHIGLDFRIDLPAAGAYNIRAAVGDAVYDSASSSRCELFDGSTSLGYVYNGGAIAGGNFADATGTVYSAANWPGSNAAISKSFAGTIARFRFGIANTANMPAAHFYVEPATLTITHKATLAVSSAGHTGNSAPAFTPTGGATLIAVSMFFAPAKRNIGFFDNLGANDSWTRIETGFYDAGSTTQLEAYILENALPTSTEVRLFAQTGGDVYDYPTIDVFEVTGLAATGKVLDAVWAYQAAVGGTTDAITPGALASQSVDRMVLGVAFDADNSPSLPNAGTNWTSVATFADYGSGATGRAEKRTYTGTSADSATWTNGSGSNKNYASLAIALKTAILSAGSKVPVFMYDYARRRH